MGTEGRESIPSLADLLAQVAQLARPAPEGLGPREAAAYLGVSERALHELNNRGLLPAPAELSIRLPRWSRSELRAWLIEGAPPRAQWAQVREAAIRRVG